MLLHVILTLACSAGFCNSHLLLHVVLAPAYAERAFASHDVPMLGND